VASRAGGVLEREAALTASELVAAEQAGLLTLTAGQALFRHPLVAASVYASAAPDLRRRAHLAVAEVLREQDLDRYAWHRAEAAPGVDEEAADELESAGWRARQRGAHGVATTAFERAGQLTADSTRRASRLKTAAETAWLAGQTGRALELLDRAEQLTADPAERARVGGLRGLVAMQSGSLRLARSSLQSAATALTARDPDAAVETWGDLVAACFYLADPATAAVAAERIEAVLSRVSSDRVRVRGTLSVGIARVLAGTEGVEQIRAAVSALAASPATADDPLRPAWEVLGPLFLRESSSGRELVARAVGEVRSRCALGRLPYLLFLTARDEATTSRWPEALSHYEEGIALAREAGMTADLAMCLAGLSWLHARMGHGLQCRSAAHEALALGDRCDVRLASAWARFARGELALSEGQMDEAVSEFLLLAELLGDTGFLDVDLDPGPELTEALLRRGDVASAVDVAERYHLRAREKGQPWALARAERALALVATSGEEQAVHFDLAAAAHARSPDAFEQARTALARGSCLRRSRRRVESRPALRSALAAFDRLGAHPWATQAATELSATGEKVVRAGDLPLDRLTTQERQIAELLAAGRTSRETAAALFLSPKTIDYHLRHVYTKLDIHSRAELADLVAHSGGLVPADR
jgi:DNA-binding CsgD family transcriptional regulator